MTEAVSIWPGEYRNDPNFEYLPENSYGFERLLQNKANGSFITPCRGRQRNLAWGLTYIPPP
jgi:hypothetical protein